MMLWIVSKEVLPAIRQIPMGAENLGSGPTTKQKKDTSCVRVCFIFDYFQLYGLCFLGIEIK